MFFLEFHEKVKNNQFVCFKLESIVLASAEKVPNDKQLDQVVHVELERLVFNYTANFTSHNHQAIEKLVQVAL